jgi:hypothetical protein
MRILSTIVGIAAIVSTEGSGYDYEGECDGKREDKRDCEHKKKTRLRPELKLKVAVEAEAEVSFSEFVEKVRKVHGPKFDKTCAEACYHTPGCRNDPHEHWSYCKYDHHPAVCFGLYHVPKHGCDHDDEKSPYDKDFGHKFGKLCYEPTNRNCPEKYPVRCSAHRKEKPKKCDRRECEDRDEDSDY